METKIKGMKKISSIVSFLNGMMLIVSASYMIGIIIAVYLVISEGFVNHIPLLAKVAIVSLVFPIISNLQKILRTVLEKNPFVAENVKRLRMIGLLVIIYNIISNILSLLFIVFDITETKILNNIIQPGNLDLSGLFVGGIIFVISEVFRIGIYLKEENELTI